ncbi:MAG TPA: efflux RND transporter periplasmic adaptor subunit [Ramlibacter sp.]|nr:efflux RND transporter periplasmic adaptor subunit [Ramlibacter sp.]
MTKETAPGAPAEPPRRKLSRRATLIGSLVALLVVGGVGWLAWDLTHPAAPAAGDGPGGPRAGASGPGGGGGGRRAGGGGGRSPATTVGVAAAERAEIPIVIDALGTVVPQATVRVRPQVSGVLQQVLYKEGQTVKKGDLLAVIDPRQFEMALQQVSGQRMRDEAQLQAARVTLERYRTLLRQDSIARQEVDTQEALVKQLEAGLVMSKANEGTARLNLSYTRIVAPITGRVGLRTVDVGNVVSTGDANGVALITQITPIDVEFAVPQDQAASLQQNAGAFMEATAFDRTRTNVLDVGVFASMDNQIDTQTGTVRAKARFNNAKLTMFPSQFVNVRLNVRTIRDAVVIPVSALRHGPTGSFVFVLKEDRTVSQRPVKVGANTADKVQIVSGLQLGERVITEGADRLRDGSRVILPGEAGSMRQGGGAGGGGGGGGGSRRRGAEGADGAASGTAPAASGPQMPQAAAPEGPRADSGPPQGGRRRGGGEAGPAGATSPPAAPQAAAAPAAKSAGGDAKPTPEQRQRFLDMVKDDPEALARRKAFLDKIDKGDPEALERWQQMRQRRSQQQ